MTTLGGGTQHGPDDGPAATRTTTLHRPAVRSRRLLVAAAVVIAVAAGGVVVAVLLRGPGGAAARTAGVNSLSSVAGTPPVTPIAATAEVVWNDPAATRVALAGVGTSLLWEGRTLVGVNERGRRLWQRQTTTSPVDDSGEVVRLAAMPGHDDLALVEGWDGEWWTDPGAISLREGTDVWRDGGTLLGTATDGLVVAALLGQSPGRVVDPATGEVVRLVDPAEDAVVTPVRRSAAGLESVSAGGKLYQFSTDSGRLTDGSGHLLARYPSGSQLVDGGVYALVADSTATVSGPVTSTLVRYSVAFHPLGSETPTWTVPISEKRHDGRTRRSPWTDLFPPTLDAAPGLLLVTDRNGVTAYGG